MRAPRSTALLAYLLGSSVACGANGTHGAGGASAAPGAVGASIAVVLGGSRVAVTNPDQGSVSFLDPDTLAVTTTTPVGGEPHALVEVAGAGAGAGPSRLFVATYRGGELVVLDASTGGVTQHVSVCAGPYGIAASPDASWVAVACEWEGTVVRVDTTTLATRTLAAGLRRPRAIAIVGTDVIAADFVGGQVHTLHADGTSSVTTLVPASAAYRPALTTMTANLTYALVPAFGAVFAAHALENNTGDTTAEPVADDYGSVTDGNPKINPAVTALGVGGPVLYAKFDGGTRVYSGPSALASFGDRYLLVAHVSTANVAVIDTTATTPDTRAVGSFSVGFGPAGVAVDAARDVAFVDNGLDQSVSRLDLRRTFAAPAPAFGATTTLVRPLPSPYSAAALAGRRLFFDATNPHVTPAGVVACASCHPEGTDDGLVWFIHTPSIPLKRRRTPHLANATTPTAPFHWDGAFSTMSALGESTMTELMAGDGLLVDTSTLQPYIDEIVKAPQGRPGDPAAVTRGGALFASTSVGCSVCHVPPAFTDGLLHGVLTPMSLTSDDSFPQANTPALHGLALRAPYFHDGRAPTLLDVLTKPYAASMGHTMGLSQGDLSDLVAYLESL